MSQISSLVMMAILLVMILIIIMYDGDANSDYDEDNQQTDLLFKLPNYSSIAMMMAMRLN